MPDDILWNSFPQHSTLKEVGLCHEVAKECDTGNRTLEAIFVVMSNNVIQREVPLNNS